MNEYYAIDKNTQKVAYKSASLFLLKNTIAYDKRDESEFIFTGDIGMRYLSKIVYVDNECVYNNKNFWVKDAQAIIEDYDEHEVIDFLGMPVDRVRFETELNAISSRVAAMDGTAGEVLYNIDTGNEMIALFKEECRLTNFVGITPMEIAVKLAPAYSLVMTGSFREAKQVFNTLEDDPFLTAERKQKYMDMLDAADAIDYATDDELIFTTKPTEELVDYVRVYLMDQSSDMTKEHTFYYAAMNQPDTTKKPRFREGDKLIYVIRHAERDSDSSSTTDINSTGVSHATSIGAQLAYGHAPSSSASDITITIEPNDASYFANDLIRSKHTAQCIALGRGDTDSAADDYSGITEDNDLLYGYRYLKSHPDSGTTDLLKRYCTKDAELSESDLAYIGAETAETARNKLIADTKKFINEIIAKADKTLNFFITSDYFVGCMQAGVSSFGYDQTSNNPWVNWCSGVAIVAHPDNTFDAFCVKCSKK